MHPIIHDELKNFSHGQNPVSDNAPVPPAPRVRRPHLPLTVGDHRESGAIGAGERRDYGIGVASAAWSARGAAAFVDHARAASKRASPVAEGPQMPGPVRVTFHALYGGDRIVAGARFLGRLDPGWWQEGALLPASLAALDMADPYRCVLAWWAAQHLPAPSRSGARHAPPYDRAVRALCLSPRQAEALGFTGVDADLLTPGWRHLITYLRAPYDRRAAAHPRLHAGRRSARVFARRLLIILGARSA